MISRMVFCRLKRHEAFDGYRNPAILKPCRPIQYFFAAVALLDRTLQVSQALICLFSGVIIERLGH